MPTGKRRRGKQGGRKAAGRPPKIQVTPPTDLILTSAKRRGVYECDYCQTDVSQLPRIRCAVCPEFDLCLDCFVNTDHHAKLSKLRNAASAHEAVGAGVSGLALTAINHHESHGYRVCDSTRYASFASGFHAAIFASEKKNKSDKNNSNSERASDATKNESNDLDKSNKSDKQVDTAGNLDTERDTEVDEKDVDMKDVDEATPASEGNDDMDVDAATSYSLDKNKDADVAQSEEDNRKPDKQVDKTNSNTTTRATMAIDDESEAKTDGVAVAGASDNKTVNPSTVAETNNSDYNGETNDLCNDTEVDDSVTESNVAEKATSNSALQADDSNVIVIDDPKTMWTVEEDLRLIEGIKVNGLGNWVEISEAVSGVGSVGKTPKRCMERYFDDYLGRYGHILPNYMLEEVVEDDNTMTADVAGKSEEGNTRSPKRRAASLRSPGSASSSTAFQKRKCKVIITENTSKYDKIWPEPYIPPELEVESGQEIGRDVAYKAEQTYVDLISSLKTREEVEAIRKEWEATRLNKPGGPTVLPMRPEDVTTLPGTDLVGFMPRRGDFDVEWENDAERAVADMEFLPDDTEDDKKLKLQILEIYSNKLVEREKRKQFVLSRQLYDYRKRHEEDQKLPRDERDLVNRMRLFERFHTPEEHKKFLEDILKAKRLRKEIAKLQMYRRIGIRTLAEAEQYELDKTRRQYHKTAVMQKTNEQAKSDSVVAEAAARASRSDEESSHSLWKHYKPSNRRARLSINRGSSENETNSVVTDALDLSVAETVDKTDTQSQSDGYNNNLLSVREKELCDKLKLSTQQYIEIKHALIHESLTKGLLDKEGPGSRKRTIAKLDVERRGDVIDFVVRAGWVSPKLGAIARQVTNEE